MVQRRRGSHLSSGRIPLDFISLCRSPGKQYTRRRQTSISGWFEDLSEAVGTELQVFETKNLRNAFATIWTASDGISKRIVVYDPNWIDQETRGSATGTNFRARLAWLLAHEIGHHICKHNEASHPRIELEADRAAGAMMATAEWAGVGSGVTLGEDIGAVINEMRQMMPVHTSDTHPGREDRVAAVMEGYRNGSPCVTSPTLWENNGQMVHLVAVGTTRKFYRYESSSKSLIFYGRQTGSAYVGETVPFRGSCSWEWPTTGTLSEDGNEIRLVARLNTRGPAECKVPGPDIEEMIFRRKR